jgi:hypothetical protein
VGQDIPYRVAGTVFFIVHGTIVFHIGEGPVNVSSMTRLGQQTLSVNALTLDCA